MISPWKRANIQRSFDSEPNYTRCAKECHVDPKTVHKYTDKGVVPKRPAQRDYRTRTAPLDEYWPEIKPRQARCLAPIFALFLNAQLAPV